jgi:diguanylate cyclase
MQRIIEAVLINIMAIVSFTAVIGEMLRNSYLKNFDTSKALSINIKMIIYFLSSVLSILLIHFDLEIAPGAAVDFRIVPIITIACWFGSVPAVFVSILVTLFKVLVWGYDDWTFYTLSAMVIISITTGIVSKLKYSFFRKSILVAGIIFIVFMCINILKTNDFASALQSVPAFCTALFVLYLGMYAGLSYLSNSTRRVKLLKDDITKDYLTGLYNSRYYNTALEDFSKSLIEKKEVFSLIYLDIDNFKAINDNYGHAVGDNVIAETSAFISNSCRKADIVSRIGGDEFTVLLPSCSDTKAYEVAERMRSTIESHSFIHKNGTSIQITVSVGVMYYSDNEKSVSQIKEEVDRAMYMAKKCGKNTVCVL